MIIIKMEGSIFDQGAEAIVNPVNCVAVMGKGLALQFKNRYPDMFREYVDDCRKGLVALGKINFYPRPKEELPLRYIVNFPTKFDWRDSSSLRAIDEGLQELKRDVVYSFEVNSIAIPPLGCGLGGLNYSDVRPLIVSAFEDIDIDLIIY